MARILLLIILIMLLYVIGKRFLVFLNAKAQQDQATKIKDENIVQCTRCGTHIPESESMLQDEKIVCKQQPCKQ